jgi:hypothetical protein
MLFIRAVRVLLGRGWHRLIIDNLGCLFILGGLAPPFAVSGKRWGEFVPGGLGSVDPDLQRLALELHNLQVFHCFAVVQVWRPWDENVRADYLPHVAEMRHHNNFIPAGLFCSLNAAWGPHTVDRFA